MSIFTKSGVVDQNRGKIATVLGGCVTGGLPWVAMELIKSGEIRTATTVTAAVFISLVCGAWLQWWARGN